MPQLSELCVGAGNRSLTRADPADRSPRPRRAPGVGAGSRQTVMGVLRRLTPTAQRDHGVPMRSQRGTARALRGETPHLLSIRWTPRGHRRVADWGCAGTEPVPGRVPSGEIRLRPPWCWHRCRRGGIRIAARCRTVLGHREHVAPAVPRGDVAVLRRTRSWWAASTGGCHDRAEDRSTGSADRGPPVRVHDPHCSGGPGGGHRHPGGHGPDRGSRGHGGRRAAPGATADHRSARSRRYGSGATRSTRSPTVDHSRPGDTPRGGRKGHGGRRAGVARG